MGETKIKLGGVNLHQRNTDMPRQSISLTEPNSKWLQKKVQTENEYASNSEAVNDLIRKEREREEYLVFLNAKLEAADKSGISTLTMAEIREKALQQLRESGHL